MQEVVPKEEGTRKMHAGANDSQRRQPQEEAEEEAPRARENSNDGQRMRRQMPAASGASAQAEQTFLSRFSLSPSEASGADPGAESLPVMATAAAAAAAPARVSETSADASRAGVSCAPAAALSPAVHALAPRGSRVARCSGYDDLVDSLKKKEEEDSGGGVGGVGGSASGVSIENPDDECVICMTEKRVTALVPCWHRCVCETCAPQFVGATCPLCRQLVETTQRVY